jgi:hypothetical protein
MNQNMYSDQDKMITNGYNQNYNIQDVNIPLSYTTNSTSTTSNNIMLSQVAGQQMLSQLPPAMLSQLATPQMLSQLAAQQMLSQLPPGMLPPVMLSAESMISPQYIMMPGMLPGMSSHMPMFFMPQIPMQYPEISNHDDNQLGLEEQLKKLNQEQENLIHQLEKLKSTKVETVEEVDANSKSIDRISLDRNGKPEICLFYRHRKCVYGANCKNLHEGSRSRSRSPSRSRRHNRRRSPARTRTSKRSRSRSRSSDRYHDRSPTVSDCNIDWHCSNVKCFNYDRGFNYGTRSFCNKCGDRKPGDKTKDDTKRFGSIIPTGKSAKYPVVGDWHCTNEACYCYKQGFILEFLPECYKCGEPKPIGHENVYGNPRQEFESIDLSAIASFTEKRTMVMINNIPTTYSENDVREELNDFNNGFLSVGFPDDFGSSPRANYVFVDFPITKKIADFYMHFEGRKWNKSRHSKVCQVSWAKFGIKFYSKEWR